MSKTLEAIVKYEELSCVTADGERARMYQLDQMFQKIYAENKAGGDILELFARYQRMYGVSGLKRKYYDWRKHGTLALADGRKMKRGRSENPFYREFRSYCERNKNTCRGGFHPVL